MTGEKFSASDVKTLYDLAHETAAECFSCAHELFRANKADMAKWAPQTTALFKRLHQSKSIDEVARVLTGKEAVKGVGKGHVTFDMETETPETANLLKESPSAKTYAAMELPGADGKPVALEDTERPIRTPPFDARPLPAEQKLKWREISFSRPSASG